MVNQGVISVSSGTTVSVSGNVVNNVAATVDLTTVTSDMNVTADVTNNGIMESRGTITLGGDWYNNSVFNAYTGTVLFNGVNQLLSGTSSTLFYNLSLDNSGIKSQTIDESVGGILNLNSVELATDAFTMFVTNPSTVSIQRVNGFVSSTSGGALSRQTNSAAAYLFPVGSSSGTVRYRPVSLTPAAATANTFEVRMANVDATSEGFNIATHEAIVCQVNSLFYHLINHTVGVNNADVVIYYDNAADGSWDAMGNWLTSPSAQWYEIAGSSTAVGVPLYTATSLGQSIPNNDRPFALTKHSLTVDLGADTTLCSGETLGLDAGNPGASYNWSTSASSQTISVTTTNTYIVTVTNPVNACQSTDDIQVSFTLAADATINAAGPFCVDSIVTDLTAAMPGGTWSGTGITNSSNGTFNPSVAGPGIFIITYGIAGSCGDTANISISVLDRPDVTITAAGPFCAVGTTVNLSAATAGGTWSGTGITDPINGTFDPVSAGVGTYDVYYSIAGQCGNNDTLSISVVSQADATISPAGPFCSDSVVTNLVAATSGGVWSGNGITNTINGTFDPAIAGAGLHTITYEITGSCGDTATLDVTVVQRADATISPAGPFCSSETSVNLSSVDVGGVWSGSGITNTSTGIFDPSSVGAGIYVITYTIGGQCGDADSESFSVINQSDATITPVGPFCDNNGVETLVAAENGGVWTGAGITNTANGTFDPAIAGAGLHDVVYIISGSCGDSDTISIEVNESPDVEIYSVAESCAGANDGAAYIDISGGTTPYIILWNTTDIIDSLGMLMPGVYSVIVSDINGCTRNMNTTVDASTDSCYVPHVYIPNIFSPNADGNNDVYLVQGKGISAITIRIYDRWGEKVFEAFDLNEGWNGEFNGKQVEQGAYPYVISLVFENETEAQIFNGYITVVR